ncbi:metalloregulator ArsR/SmtB family transcription factor [Kocuria flava]|uniref:ArsR/SmtB family transcription factor n=1 Tax=Kocuria flava TaxID=446860 RepID=UPI001FF5B709|nr:metalloregulator ArsR/SmtB family transcription factor [Kocuria flava]MCJ8504823.1 metalloregulator ArsR/SmtB family transcription factor [Kocuria flava]
MYRWGVTTVTPPHTAALARLGHALSDGVRTRILLALRAGPATPSQLVEALGVSKQVVSNQLACLRGCGLVTATKEGRRSWYRLADPRLGAALGDLLELVVTVDPDCCTPEGCTCA